MKGINSFSLIIKITSAVATVLSIVASYMLFDTPSSSGIGKVLLVISVLVMALLILEFATFRSRIRRYISSMSLRITNTERESFLYFPAPVIIIDDNNTVVWYNRCFGKEVYTDGEAFGLNINEIVDIDMEKVFSDEGELVCLKNRFYQTIGVHTERKGQLSMIYFNDTTDFVELEYEYKQSQKTVIIICIDNFDDLMVNIRESEKAHALVQIEKLIENFVEGTTAFCKKISSDKFYVIMEERHLAPIIEQRFKILEQARAITVGEKQNFTLSIGVGYNGKNLEESENNAKQALEMCLGRGGDQAAVKSENGYNFFGGVSNGMEKSTKVKTRMVAKAMQELINSRNKILIMGHKFSDLDSVGAAVGMCSAVKSMGKESYVVINKDQTLSKRLVQYLDENDINKYFIKPADAIEKMDENTMLIIVDTHNPDLVESKEVLTRSQAIVIIDHHRLMVKAIENNLLFYHEPNSSSASEMVAELIDYFDNKVRMPVPVANAMLSGIMLDTKNFVMKTGVRTFEAAALLRKYGANTITVKDFFANSIEIYQRKSKIINSAKIYRKCAIACADELSEDIRIVSSQAADDMLGISGVSASFVLYEDNGIVNISGRSMGNFNVQIVMESLGGGGHLNMAATQLHTDLLSAAEQLKEAIDEYIRNNS